MKEFTRQELYDAIWSKSAVQLAKEVGVSDVAISKACKRYEIPKPPPGYWAKVQHGRKIKRPPLTKLDDPRRQSIQFEPVPEHRRPVPLSELTAERIKSENADENRIVVPDKLESPVPVVDRTVRSLTSAAPNDDGIVVPKAKNCLEVAVGKDSIERAMRIMNAFITAGNDRGFKVTAEENHKWATLVHVDGEAIAVRLSESLGERPRQLTRLQRQENARYSILKPYPETEKYPRGLLTLSARGESDGYIEKRWSELDGRRLEDRLNQIVAWLFRAAEQIRNRRIEFAERDRRWAEERRQREEEERRQRQNERKLRELEEEAAAWCRARKIRDYLEAAERSAHDRGEQIEQGSELSEWLKWARSKADEIDPLV